MREKRLFIFLICSFVACNGKNDFTRSASGMEYKLVQRDAGGVPVKPGQYLKLSVVQRYGDTILRDPSRSGYEYQLIDSSQMTEQAWELLHDACMNDSLVFRVSSDSAFKNKKPAFVKKKDWLVTTVKVLGILANTDSVYSDRERQQLKNGMQ
ncbi:MAG: hypothetical protein V4539_10090 [Bacteroidota bacterium]